MVKYIDWGKHLRLGNWLFLYAGIQSILKDAGNPLALPPYFLWKYLEHSPFVTENTNYSELFQFTQFNYTSKEKARLKEFFKQNSTSGISLNINIGAHLQSEKWFIDDIDYIKEKLRIKQNEIDKVKDKYADFFTKKTIGIGVRRGDFVGHGCFYQIPENWYTLALEQYFPDWQDYNIIIFSDDINWCKRYYAGRGFLFAEPNNTHTHADNFKYYHNDPMEQFILGISCDNFIGGSSTFSWWQMWYVKNFNGGKVIHSGRNLRGECHEKYFNPDFYPGNWVLHETD